VEDIMNLIDEKTALIELTDAELYEVAGGNFVFTINNQESNQGDSQLFIVAHTIIAIALGILSLTGGFLLLTNRRRPA